MDERQKYASIENAYKEIAEIIKDNKYTYVELNETIPEPIRIGSIANDEFRFSAGILNSHQKWETEESAAQCIENIHKLYSDKVFEENKRLASNEITKRSGLITRVTDYTKMFNEKNVNFFSNLTPSESHTFFDRTINTNKAISYFGYFTPSESGTHMFYRPDLDIYQLWIADDNALYDYKNDNSDLNSKTSQIEIHLKKNYYYPIRVQMASSRKVNADLIRILSPNGTIITRNTQQYKYFVTPLSGGNVYMKKLIYFGLVRSDDNPTHRNEPLFKCFFIDTNSRNYEIIEKLKTNTPLVYFNVDVPTELTFESDVYKKRVNENKPLEINDLPPGVDLNVTKSKYGMDYNRKEDHGKYIWVALNEKIPAERKLMYKTVKWTDYNVPYNRAVNHHWKGAGWLVREYSGYWNGNESHFHHSRFKTAFIVTDPYLWNKDRNRKMPEHTSYILEGNVSTRSSWYMQFRMDSDDQAKLYVNGSHKLTTNCCTAGHVDLIHHDQIKHVKVLCGNGGGPGYMMLFVRKRYRRRRRWRWSHYWPMNHEYNVSHDVKYNYTVPDKKDIARSREDKVKPTKENNFLKKKVWQANWVTLPSSFDVTNNADDMVKGDQLSVQDYNQHFGDPAPGWDRNKRGDYYKKFNVQYGYTQKFDANDATKSITNKNIHLDDQGKLVMGYDFNNKTNATAISIMNIASLCKDKKNCKYSLVLEDDGSISIYDNSNKEIWNKMLMDPNVNLDKVVTVDGWLVNPKRRNFLDLGQKLSSNDISEIISNNGKYKLSFDANDKLVLTYAINAYDKTTANGMEIYYTNSLHKNDGNQIYHLYRCVPDDLIGKKFVSRNSESENIKNLELLPNSLSNVLQFDSYESQNERYPLFKSSDYNAIFGTNADNITIDNKYRLYNADEEDCEAYCKNNEECEHFFLMNTRTGTKCLQDITSNRIPIYTTKKPDNNISDSKMKTKQYTINTTCGDPQTNIRNQKLPNVPASDYSNYTTVYTTSHANDPKDTYYCSNEQYKLLNQQISDTYASKESFTNREGYEDVCGTADCMLSNKIPSLETHATSLEKKQHKINNNYYSTKDKILKLKHNLTDTNGPQINTSSDYNKDGIPDLYKMNMPDKPQLTVTDAMEEDAKTLLIYENTMYTIATVSLATVLIGAIILTK